MNDSDSAQKRIAAARWYHTFEVRPGIITPGGNPSLIDPGKILNERYSLPLDSSGMTALDVGALDGVYAFELERRGAIVTALDIQDPDQTGFSTAKSVRNSKVRYVQGNVYDLSTLLEEKFDVVTYFGVWYHLKNPVAAFEKLCAILKDAGSLLLEGECLINFAEDPGRGEAHDPGLIKALAESSLPLTLFYVGEYKGSRWNWYIPNVACLKEWLASAGRELVSHGLWDAQPNQRLYGIARKAEQSQATVENPLWTNDNR